MADLETVDEAPEEDAALDTEDDFSLWEKELAEDAEGEDPDELERKRSNSERAKISLPETIIFMMLALFTDSIEFLAGFANILPVIGQAIWFMVWVFGLIVSAVIILWLFLRGASGQFAIKRVVINTVGALFDAGTAGFLPIRFVVLGVTIGITNHLENKEINRIVGLLSKIK